MSHVLKIIDLFLYYVPSRRSWNWLSIVSLRFCLLYILVDQKPVWLPSRKISCLTNLLSTYSEVFDSIDKKHSCNVIYLNFNKAFDSVPHFELLYKLWSLGITGPLWSWFRQYLSNRLYTFCENWRFLVRLLACVIWGNAREYFRPPIFFICINDQTTSFNHSSSYIFTNDTKLLKSILSQADRDLLQFDLNCLLAWCDKWHIQFNLSKRFSICFSFTQLRTEPYKLNGKNISQVCSQKDLGVTITSSLSWSEHISRICRSTYLSLNLIRKKHL